jgi:Myo-inositol oxygenase
MENLTENAPLKQLDDWDDFVATRYRQGKAEEEFRNYKAEANPRVTEFYRQNHAHQTFDFVVEKKTEYCRLNRGKKSIWEMAEYLNTLVDICCRPRKRSGRMAIRAGSSSLVSSTIWAKCCACMASHSGQWWGTPSR